MVPGTREYMNTYNVDFHYTHYNTHDTLDLLINPHGQPSRMTVSYMVGQLVAKYTALSAEHVDATSFSTSYNNHTISSSSSSSSMIIIIHVTPLLQIVLFFYTQFYTDVESHHFIQQNFSTLTHINLHDTRVAVLGTTYLILCKVYKRTRTTVLA